MRILVQRVKCASVSIAGVETARIGAGMLILLGIAVGDTEEDLEWLVKKVVKLRIFDDAAGIMNLNVRQTQGDILTVSQFTLLASTKKGNRPSYIRAADETEARPLYENFLRRLSDELGKSVRAGVFGADMQIGLVNDGPVTIWIDSRSRE